MSSSGNSPKHSELQGYAHCDHSGSTNNVGSIFHEATSIDISDDLLILLAANFPNFLNQVDGNRRYPLHAVDFRGLFWIYFALHRQKMTLPLLPRIMVARLQLNSFSRVLFGDANSNPRTTGQT